MPRICHNIHGMQVFHLLWCALIYHCLQQTNNSYECFRFSKPSSRAANKRNLIRLWVEAAEGQSLSIYALGFRRNGIIILDFQE